MLGQSPDCMQDLCLTYCGHERRPWCVSFMQGVLSTPQHPRGWPAGVQGGRATMIADARHLLAGGLHPVFAQRAAAPGKPGPPAPSALCGPVLVPRLWHMLLLPLLQPAGSTLVFSTALSLENIKCRLQMHGPIPLRMYA